MNKDVSPTIKAAKAPVYCTVIYLELLADLLIFLQRDILHVAPKDHQQKKQGWRKVELQSFLHEWYQGRTHINQLIFGGALEIPVEELQNIDLQARLGGCGFVLAGDDLTNYLFDVVNHVFHWKCLKKSTYLGPLPWKFKKIPTIPTTASEGFVGA